MIGRYSMATDSVDITPRKPIPLAGYSALRKSAFEKVADPLEANIVILRNGDILLAFISLDLMYVGARLRDEIVAGISARIPAERIFLTASHTHFGPPTEESLPILGAVTPEYVDFIAERVISLSLALLKKAFTSVSLEYVQGSASHSINRRSRSFGISRTFPFLGSQVRIKPNVAGPRDDAIRVIRIRGEGDTDLGVCWSYACHPVGYPSLNEVSADYPGVVRRMLRSAFGNIPVVFWQGFSGNIRPLVLFAAPGNGTALHGRPSFAPLNQAEWERWSRSLGTCVLEAAKGRGTLIQGPISCDMRSLGLDDLGLASEKHIDLQEIRLGDGLIICGLNAEVAVEYGEMLKRVHAPAAVIPVGCVGDVFGYLPTSAMVPEGGYEAQDFLPRFGLAGHFSGDIDAIVERKLLRPPG
jgi:hypothetical protein